MTVTVEPTLLMANSMRIALPMATGGTPNAPRVWVKVGVAARALVVR